MTKSICNKLFLKRCLFGLHVKEGTSLKDHLDELNSILMELRDIDVKIEDEDASMILLASLPPLYESFVNSLSVGKECVTMKEVKSSLSQGNFDLKHLEILKNQMDLVLLPLTLTRTSRKRCLKERRRFMSIQRTSVTIARS